MSIRPLISVVALTIAAPLVAQLSPREAARTFTLDGVAPSPSPSPEAAPAAAPDPAASPPLAPATESASPPPPAPGDAAAPSVGAPTLSVPVLPESAAVTASPPAPAPAVRAVFTLDTPIQDLIADPDAKAVLDKDLPGVSDDENLDKFKTLSLRSFQPMTGGQMTDAMLAKVAADLDVLAGGTGAVTAPVRVGNARHGKDDSR